MEHRGEGMDAVDEALYYFRAEVLFRTFDVQGPGDKTLIYLTLFASQCLKRIANAANRQAAAKLLAPSATDNTFKLPGDAGFPLGGLLAPPADKHEAELFRGYMRQAREQLVERLLERCFPMSSGGAPNKFWLAFHHRKFLGKDMNHIEV